MKNKITRFRGDTLTPEQITVFDKLTGLGINIAGATFVMTVNTEENPVNDTNKVCQMVGVITDAANGVVEFTLTDSDADNVGEFYYDVEMTSGGKPTTVIKDLFNISQDITKT